MGFNVYGLMPIIGVVVYIVLLTMLPSFYMAEAVLCMIGVLAFMFHKRVIKMLVNRFMKQKYARLEELRK